MILLSPPPPIVQALADTVVTIPSRGALEMAADAAVLVLALALAATFAALVLFLRRLYGLEREVRAITRRAGNRLGPTLDRTRDIADNVEFVTRAVRTDVERLNASVKALSDRLGQASDRMEERIEEFNALMEVVQSEAESIFLGTASTVRGVKAGARAMGGDAGDQALEPTPPGNPVEPGVAAEEGVYLTGGMEEAGSGEESERRKEA